MNIGLLSVEEWKKRFSKFDLQSLHGSTSPVEIIVIENYRKLAAEHRDLGPTTPVDVFVFASGEPPLQHTTKVSGLPYRPSGVPWPHDLTGRPLTFLAQFCFADSRDHVADLPGDVLLVFARTYRAPLLAMMSLLIDPMEDVNSLVFEWYHLGLDNLVKDCEIPDLPPPWMTEFHVAREVPAEPLNLPVCYGVRHRSVDYVDEFIATSALAEVLPPSSPPIHEFFEALKIKAFARYDLMKVGGVPVWYNEPQQTEGRFIAGFSGVLPASDVPFPWVNQRKPKSCDSFLRKDKLRLGDPGYLNFFLTADGAVKWYKDSCR